MIFVMLNVVAVVMAVEGEMHAYDELMRRPNDWDVQCLETPKSGQRAKIVLKYYLGTLRAPLGKYSSNTPRKLPKYSPNAPQSDQNDTKWHKMINPFPLTLTFIPWSRTIDFNLVKNNWTELTLPDNGIIIYIILCDLDAYKSPKIDIYLLLRTSIFQYFSQMTCQKLNFLLLKNF